MGRSRNPVPETGRETVPRLGTTNRLYTSFMVLYKYSHMFHGLSINRVHLHTRTQDFLTNKGGRDCDGILHVHPLFVSPGDSVCGGGPEVTRVSSVLYHLIEVQGLPGGLERLPFGNRSSSTPYF